MAARAKGSGQSKGQTKSNKAVWTKAPRAPKKFLSNFFSRSMKWVTTSNNMNNDYTLKRIFALLYPFAGLSLPGLIARLVSSQPFALSNQ